MSDNKKNISKDTVEQPMSMIEKDLPITLVGKFEGEDEKEFVCQEGFGTQFSIVFKPGTIVTFKSESGKEFSLECMVSK